MRIGDRQGPSVLNQQDHRAVIFDTASGQWLKRTPDGGMIFVADKSQASEIEPSELQACIRSYELEYLRYSLVTQPIDAPPGDLPPEPSQTVGA